jgi:hypothetical protein
VSNLVIGVLGVLAVAATGALLKWGNQAFAAIRGAVSPDHNALYRTPAWGLMAVQSGGPSRIRLVIACAPNRSLRRASFSPDAAIRFIHRQFPGQFPEQPASSDVRIGVKFTVSPTGSTEDGYAWAWVTGRIDLSTYIHLKPADGRYIVPITAILEAIAQMAEAVASSAYRRSSAPAAGGPAAASIGSSGLAASFCATTAAPCRGMISTFPAAGRSGPAPASTRTARREASRESDCAAGTLDVRSVSC